MPWGYGIFCWGKKHISAHRYAWIITHGDPGGLLVCHHCDNPPCVNPAHLFLGTTKDNSEDMMKKGRNKYRPDITKLTKEQVIDIRERYLPRIKGKQKGNAIQLSRQYGITNTQLYRIVQHKAWRHVP